MKVVLYGVNFQDAPFPGNLAVLTKAARSLGHEAKTLNGKFFGRLGGDDKVEPADLAFVAGAQQGFKLIPAQYRASRTPCYVNDLGFLRRDLDYFQLCPYGLNRLYPGDYPTDRFEELKLTIQPQVYGGPVLICGQKSGDAQHDIADIAAWTSSMIDDIRKHTQRDIIFRPHPRDRMICKKADYWSDPLHESLKECIYRHRVSVAVMYNSTSAFECLMTGVPVIAVGDCMYDEVACKSLEQIDSPFFPDKDQLVKFLSKVAYHQFRTDELGTWKPIEFMLEKHRESNALLS